MVLITGATGFLGSHLLIHLVEKGEAVRALYRDSSKLEAVRSLFSFYNKEELFSKVEWFQADITAIPSLELAYVGIEQIYHCAGFISFDLSDEEQLRKVNIEGTANIVNLALVHNVDKLCFVSSIAALGDLQEHEDTVTEETEWNAEKYHSDYAISKYGAEMEIWRGQQEGLDAVIVNPGVILGPDYNATGSGKIFLEVKNGLKYYTKGSTGFVAVQDVVHVMYTLMKSDIKGERFILVGENMPYEKLLKTIASELKVRGPHIYAQKWLSEIVWRLGWIVSKVFFVNSKLSKAMLKSLYSEDRYSNQKIREVNNFEFTDISDTIIRTAAFYGGDDSGSKVVG